MKRLITLWLAAFMGMSLFAQQAQEDRRTTRIYEFPSFRKATVLQSFGRTVEATANILLTNSSLVYRANDTVYVASNPSIVGVVFEDSVRYLLVEEHVLGREVASQNYNSLLRVTTIDKKRYKEETGGGVNPQFLNIDMGIAGGNFFLDIDGDKWNELEGYPLKDKYYFSLHGVIVPANQTAVKKYIKPDMRTAFKNLMNDRWWSWKDQESLKLLLMYFP